MEPTVFDRYRAAFGGDPPLVYRNEEPVSEVLVRLMEEAIARGRPLSPEDLGGGCPPGAEV
jgi:hypothetical protein